MAYELEYKKVHNTLGEPNENKYGENIGQFVMNLAPTESQPLFSFSGSEARSQDDAPATRAPIDPSPVDPETPRIYKWDNPLITMKLWKDISSTDKQNIYGDFTAGLQHLTLIVEDYDYIGYSEDSYFGARTPSGVDGKTRSDLGCCDTSSEVEAIGYKQYSTFTDKFKYFFLVKRNSNHGHLQRPESLIRVLKTEGRAGGVGGQTDWVYNAQDFLMKNLTYPVATAPVTDLIEAHYRSGLIPVQASSIVTIQSWGRGGEYLLCGFSEEKQEYYYFEDYDGDLIYATDTYKYIRIPGTGPILNGSHTAGTGNEVSQWYLLFFKSAISSNTEKQNGIPPYIFTSERLLEIIENGQIVNGVSLPDQIDEIEGVTENNIYTDEEIDRFLNPEGVYPNGPYEQYYAPGIYPFISRDSRDIRNENSVIDIQLFIPSRPPVVPADIEYVNLNKLKNGMKYKKRNLVIAFVRDMRTAQETEYIGQNKVKHIGNKRYRIIRAISFQKNSQNCTALLPTFEGNEDSLIVTDGYVDGFTIHDETTQSAEQIKSYLIAVRNAHNKYQCKSCSNLLRVCQLLHEDSYERNPIEEGDEHGDIIQERIIHLNIALTTIPKRLSRDVINQSWHPVGPPIYYNIYNGSHVQDIPQNEDYYTKNYLIMQIAAK